jgi:hypothetical protein
MSDWEKLYQAAIVETDWSKIEERIQAADSAISAHFVPIPNAPTKALIGL